MDYVVPLIRDKLDKGIDPKAFAKEGISTIQKTLKPFETAYEHAHIYLTHDEPGLADCVLAVILDYLSVLPTAIKIMEDFPNLQNMLESFQKRQSFQNTIPAIMR